MKHTKRYISLTLALISILSCLLFISVDLMLYVNAEELIVNGKTLNPEKNGIVIEKITTTIVTDEDELALASEMGEDPIDEFTIVLKHEIQARNNFPIPIYNPDFCLDYHVFEPDFEIAYFYGDDELCQVNWIEVLSDIEMVKKGERFTSVRYCAISDPYYLCQSVHVSSVGFYTDAGHNITDYQSVDPQKSPYFKFKDYKKARSLIHPVGRWHDISFIGDPWDPDGYQNYIHAGAYHTVYVHDDGTVGFAGRTDNNRCKVEDWTDIIAVDASSHTVGLKSDGTVVATGPNGKKQCNVSKWEDIVAIAAGAEHTLGLKSDGTVVAVGNSSKNSLKVSSWQDIVAIDAGSQTSYGLKSDGTVVATGKNSSGQTKVAKWTDITAISAGDRHVVGLKSDGTVVAVGGNSFGECDVEGWTDIVAIAAGSQFTIGLKSDGSVVATGNNKYGQCDVSKWREIEKIVVGQNFVIGIEGGYYVYAGSNGYGQCDLK